GEYPEKLGKRSDFGQEIEINHPMMAQCIAPPKYDRQKDGIRNLINLEIDFLFSDQHICGTYANES
ncbi:MAG: hypothetical protein ABI615_02675, partial [Chthoniobacterales bacterium]